MSVPTRLALLLELKASVPDNKHLQRLLADDIENEIKLSAEKLRKEYNIDHCAFHTPPDDESYA